MFPLLTDRRVFAGRGCLLTDVRRPRAVLSRTATVSWAEAEEPTLPGPYAALARPVAIATCDLDVAVLAGRYPLQVPCPFGHEGVMEVVEAGGQVTGVAPGDLAVVPFQISCGACEPCRRGRTGNCAACPRLPTYGPGPGTRDHRPLLAMVIVRAMTRIPYVRREELGPEGQQLWDSIVSGRGDLVVTAGGGLAGPFNAFVTAPGAGRRLSSLGATLRFGTSIERRLSEIAIITIGARWQAEFEWWAHAPMAREHGVADAVVDAIGRGEDPLFEADDERAVYTVARQLSLSGRLDQEAYDAAHRFLGDAGMVELVSLCGYYTLISFLLNAFAVPLPPDAAPMWAES